MKHIVEKQGNKVNQNIKNEFYYFKRIESYSNAQKLDLALECANEAIEEFPFCELLYASRGEIYFSKHLIDEAIKDYETAIQLGMEEKLLLNNLGLCYGIKRQYARAIECLSRSIELGNENVNTYLARAKVLRKIGEIDKALLDEAKATRLSSVEIDSRQKERCEIHGIRLEIIEIRRITEFVNFSDDYAYFVEKLKEAEKRYFPNAELLIPNTYRKDTDEVQYFNKYWVCDECKKEKNEWINKHESEIYSNYQKEKCNLESDYWQKRKKMAEVFSNKDFRAEVIDYVKEKRKSQEALLEEGNFDAWVEFANSFAKNRNLTEKEINKIRYLSEKKDFENLREFILSLSSSRIIKFKALFKKLVSILMGKQ